MKRILLLSILFSTVAFTSCTKHRLRGEGATISDTRYVSNFTKIIADGSTAIEIRPSNENRVVVTGYESLVPAYETETHEGVLRLQFKDKYINIKNNNLRVTVYSKDVNTVKMNGSGSVSIDDDMKSSYMEAEINGSGSVTIGNNHFDKMKLKINGSGDIESRRGVGEDVEAIISGSGDINITVENTLYAKISGSGTVYYWGNPSVSTDISGSGKVRKQ